jgi:diaminopimelate decarboxylase
MSEQAERAFAIASRHPTPLFVFAPARTAEALRTFRQLADRIPLGTEIFYSYKTNYLPALCEWLADAGVGAEVTSPVEWDLARRYHRPERIIVNGLGKCADGLLPRIVQDADTSPRLVNLETDTEVDLVTRRPGRSVPLQVGLRVGLPEFAEQRGADPSQRWGHRMDKFGWNADGEPVVQAAKLLAAAGPAIDLTALHIHATSQLVSATRFAATLARICGLLTRLRRVGVTISTLDLGGGIASGWVGKTRTGPLFDLAAAAGLRLPLRPQQMPDLDGIGDALNRYHERFTDLGVTTLLFEPGRYLAEPSMVAVAEVIAVRRDGHRTHAVLNIGTNVLKCWRPSEIRPVTIRTDPAGTPERVELVGPLCHRSDTFGSVLAPAPVRVGDLVCFDAVGAYTLGDDRQRLAPPGGLQRRRAPAMDGAGRNRSTAAWHRSRRGEPCPMS